MPKLVDPEKVLRSRNLSESAVGNIVAIGEIVDTISYVVEGIIDTPVERYQRFDFFDHRPSRMGRTPTRPLQFRLTQGFVDSAVPLVWYYAKDNTQAIQVVVPEAASFALTSVDGLFDETQVTLDHVGTVTSDWVITFTTDVLFTVEDGNGVLISGGPFDISNDWAELRGSTGEAYFRIPSAAWTGPFVAGDTLTFSTTAADTYIADTRYFHVNYEDGIVTLTNWGNSGTRKFVAGYTAGFEDDGDCMIGVPRWLENAAITTSVRYLLAIASKHNPKARSDAEIRTQELAQFMGAMLNPHQRPRYLDMHWPVDSRETFLGHTP